MRIRYHSWQNRPPHRVTCRTADTTESFAGCYVGSAWLFDVPDGAPGSQFHLTLDGQVRSAALTAPASGVLDVDEGDVAFSRPDIAVDEGRLQRTWFDQGAVDQDRWDIVVVGTGIGGGTLLAELARKLYAPGGNKYSVLGLDAGSMLFTGHVANQPRVLSGASGAGATALWNSLSTFGSQPYTLGSDIDPKNWYGWHVFALGGRSLFWGGLCPRIDRTELTTPPWPASVVNDLVGYPGRRGYYDRAESVLWVDDSRTDSLETDSLRLLSQLEPDRKHASAPVALRRPKRNDWGIPAGLFSTAERLLAQRLGHADGDSFGPPYVHLAELVTSLTRDGRDWLVHGVDLRDGSPTLRRAGTVVLCAGTVESARIMATSELAAKPATIGQRLTEHPMAYRWFQVPADSPYCRTRSAADLLSTPGVSGDTWNMQLQINSDRIFDHAPATGIPRTETITSDGAVAAQLVFLDRAELNPTGRVDFDSTTPWLDLDSGVVGRPGRATLHMAPPTAPPQRWIDLANTIVAELGGESLPNSEWPGELRTSALGSVSHEVGTMRMGVDDSDAVVDDNLQVFGQPGLYVCDNSVFPASPAANPSLTLSALALRLADRLWP